MQARTEPKLHPETANMKFEKVTASRSATLKAGLKANLESKWFLRRCSWKFHVGLSGDGMKKHTKETGQILHSLQKSYSGSRSVVGKELKPKRLQEKVVLALIFL